MADKNNKDKIKKPSIFTGLRGQFFAIGLISVVLLALSVVFVSIFVIKTAMNGQVKDELQGCVAYIEGYYDQIEGDFKLVIVDDTGYIYKGDTDITEDYSMLDMFSGAFDADVSIFCSGTRVLTTFKDADHNRLVNTGSAYTVIQDVLEGGKDVFYEDVKINDEKYFAYYKPIVNSDGSVFGMYGVCRNSAKVNRGVYRAIIPIILIFAAAAVIVALATASEAGKTVGMLNVLNRFMEKVAKSDFEADLPHDVLTSDDEVGALAKTGKQMQNSLRKLVDYDALTEVYNRRYATGELKEIRENSNIDGTDFCVAIADIDFFKKVNDTYGHDAGDLVLKEVASVFKRNMGGHGFVARWGGEEFLFVFTTCVLSDAQDVLLKIMDDIRRLEISYGEHIISPRISAGLIQAQRDEEADKCVKRADDLLYYAKGHGRDRLVSEDDTEFIRLPENDENE